MGDALDAVLELGFEGDHIPALALRDERLLQVGGVARRVDDLLQLVLDPIVGDLYLTADARQLV